MSYTLQKGQEGEQLVAKYLTDRGYTVLQNYRFATGEIDIIAKKDVAVAFVEVKWRNNALIDPAEVITFSKQKKIISVAKRFISQYRTNLDMIYRFDVALVETDNNNVTIRYIHNAFSAFE